MPGKLRQLYLDDGNVGRHQLAFADGYIFRLGSMGEHRRFSRRPSPSTARQLRDALGERDAGHQLKFRGYRPTVNSTTAISTPPEKSLPIKLLSSWPVHHGKSDAAHVLFVFRESPHLKVSQHHLRPVCQRTYFQY